MSYYTGSAKINQVWRLYTDFLTKNQNIILKSHKVISWESADIIFLIAELEFSTKKEFLIEPLNEIEFDINFTSKIIGEVYNSIIFESTNLNTNITTFSLGKICISHNKLKLICFPFKINHNYNIKANIFTQTTPILQE